ncbi:hypothetical protein ZWY2020_052554 [Hordeum vulgare]|nr:hypothetical protein ZWY2020_052554 [Hordeum vulgare]
MGMNLGNMAKMIRCAGNNDIITIKADDSSNTATFMFELPNQDKISDFEIKLMDIDRDHLGIPDSEYYAIVCMLSSEFSRICKDLSGIGDTGMLMSIIESVKISTTEHIGTANIVCSQNKTVDKAHYPNLHMHIYFQTMSFGTYANPRFPLRRDNQFTFILPTFHVDSTSYSNPILPIIEDYMIIEYVELLLILNGALKNV